MKYLKIVLPIYLPTSLTYVVPNELVSEVAIGKRAIVPLGKSKLYTGIIWDWDDKPVPDIQYKSILEIIDLEPLIRENQRKFWEWIAEYYLCSLGEVMKAALPAPFKLSSDTFVKLTPQFEMDFAEDVHSLSPAEEGTLALLRHEAVTLAKLGKYLNLKNPLSIVKKLMERNWVETIEEVKPPFKPKTIKIISLNIPPDDEQLSPLIESMNKAKKQQQILLHILDPEHWEFNGSEPTISQKELLIRFPGSLGAINGLIKKGILARTEIPESQLIQTETNQLTLPQLSDEQQHALEKINASFTENKPVLLHGITGSGKTEIYIQLIREALALNKQVLYLLPEIGLTTQIIGRLEQVFGNTILVYHSRNSENQRAEIYQKVAKNHSHPQLIVGARSALFLPFNQLALLIVDEEHDSSYKQQSPAPRYQGRDMALVLAKRHQAGIVLGSATPSLESYALSLAKRFTYIQLNKRYHQSKLPSVHLIDLKKERLKKKLQGSFSLKLIDTMKETLANQEQVMLFQNRRGFNPYLICPDCGHIPKCKNCDVSLTYHRFQHAMVCHYCGHREAPIKECKACGFHPIQFKGLGTEKIEEEIQELFPKAKVARLDLDTARSKKNYERILEEFANRNIDILVGTQMISKGLDFSAVSLVGILDADLLLNYPDFRSAERSFQLMVQVGGRSGRREKQGQVLIQSSNPDHPVLEWVMKTDYQQMANHLLHERKLFHYPPYTRLVQIILRHRNENSVVEAADFFAQILRQEFHEYLLGPEIPAVSRIQNFYIRNLILKIPRSEPNQSIKAFLQQQRNWMLEKPRFKNLQIHFDADPQ